MNFVGKMLILLTLAMSVVFMAFALCVYAAHRNWKNAMRAPARRNWAGGIQLKQREEKKRDAGHRGKNRLKTEVAKERQAQLQALAKVESQRDELIVKRNDLQKERDAFNLKDKESVAGSHTAQTALDKLTKEVEGLRKEIRVAQEERDKQFKQVVATTDNIHQVSLELKVVKNARTAGGRTIGQAQGDRGGLGWSGIEQVSELHGKVLAVNAEDSDRSVDRQSRRAESRQHAGGVSRQQIPGPGRSRQARHESRRGQDSA